MSIFQSLNFLYVIPGKHEQFDWRIELFRYTNKDVHLTGRAFGPSDSRSNGSHFTKYAAGPFRQAANLNSIFHI